MPEKFLIARQRVVRLVLGEGEIESSLLAINMF